LIKQSSLDDAATLELEMNDQLEDEMKEIEERRAMEESGELPQPPSPRPLTPMAAKNKGNQSIKLSNFQRTYFYFVSVDYFIDERY